MLGMEFGTVAGVEAVPFGAAILHYLYHAKEGAAHDRHRCPHLAPAAEDAAPIQPSMQSLLGSPSKDIWVLAEDIHQGQYQMAHSIFPHRCQDLLMQDLHDELDQQLVRAGLHSASPSGRSQSRGRAHCHAPPQVPSSSQAHLPSPEVNSREGTIAPLQHG